MNNLNQKINSDAEEKKDCCEMPLTKRERKLLRKQQKEKDEFSSLRLKKIKKIIFVSIIVLMIGGAVGLFAKSYTSEEKHLGAPKLEIFENEYDAGDILMSGGLIRHTYEIKNTGEGDLKIDKVWTSCHCTTAILKVGDKESPEFGMDGSRAFWSQKLAPGETGQLEVIFDPAFHGHQGMGQAIRVVYLSTNDPQNKRAEFKMSANVQ